MLLTRGEYHQGERDISQDLKSNDSAKFVAEDEGVDEEGGVEDDLLDDERHQAAHVLSDLATHCYFVLFLNV